MNTNGTQIEKINLHFIDEHEKIFGKIHKTSTDQNNISKWPQNPERERVGWRQRIFYMLNTLAIRLAISGP